MKKLRLSKTFWVNLLVIGASVLTAMAGSDVIVANPEIAAYFAAAVGVVNILLRVVTGKPIKGV